MVVVNVNMEVEENFAVIRWAAGASGDTGKPVDVSRYPYIASQIVAGTVGTSTLQGSLDGTTWGAIGAGHTLAASNAVTQTTGALRYIRPNFGAGATGAELMVIAGRAAQG